MSGIDYDKKIARCERLGSKKFMKLVEKVEKVKFKVLKKVLFITCILKSKIKKN